MVMIADSGVLKKAFQQYVILIADMLHRVLILLQIDAFALVQICIVQEISI